ncbi:MAG: S8 family serine peptidase [Acidobacteriota bacterium]
MKKFLVCCLAGGLLIGGSATFAAQPGDAHGLTPIPGSYLVTLEARADRPALRGLIRAFGARIQYEYQLTANRINVRDLPAGAMTALAHAAGVVRVDPDFVVSAQLVESTVLIGAEPVLASTSGGSGSNVCVLDTGINPTHLMFDDVPSRIVAWKDFVGGGATPLDDNGHGSNVAGIVGGREGVTLGGAPFHGVAPAANLYIGKVLDGAGSGAFSDVQAGIDWCAGLAADSPSPRADVINMSLGAGSFSTVCDSSDTTGTAQVVNAAAAAGVLVVTSAGNESNRNAVGTPACASGSMAIGATYDADVGRIRFQGCQDRKTFPDKITCFSNEWDNLDVVAPGCITSSAASDSNNGTTGFCGTSQASPHVAGLAALVFASTPGLTAGDVRGCINSSAVDLGTAGFDKTFGNGRIDVAAAVAACQGGACTVTENPEVSCTDGIDNDCDGLIDAADPDCQTCTITESPEVSCTDGIDNDCDGLIDAADPDCQTCTITESPEVSCTDGIDNDCDGLTDAADPDCQTCNLGQIGDSCTSNADCCSNKCKGKPGAKTCK